MLRAGLDRPPGTPPGGCGIELDKRLQAGDVIELDITGIGILRNALGARKGR